MSKLTKKEKDKLTMQMTTVRRSDTWVGIRPAVFESKKYSSKRMRRESRQLCRNYD